MPENVGPLNLPSANLIRNLSAANLIRAKALSGQEYAERLEADYHLKQQAQSKSIDRDKLVEAGEWLAHCGLAMPGYGQIFVRGDEVWYVGGDGDEDGFSKIVKEKLGDAGASKVEYEAEGFPPQRDTWEQIWPVKTKDMSYLDGSRGGALVPPPEQPKSQFAGDLDWLKEEQEETEHLVKTVKAIRKKYRKKKGFDLVASERLDPAIAKSAQAAGKWLAEKWAQLETRYGRKTALAMAVASLITFPIPFNITAIIAIAEAVRGVSGKSLKVTFPKLRPRVLT